MFSDLFLTIFRIWTLPFEFDYEVSLARTYLNCWIAEVKAAIFVLFCDFWGIFQSFIIDYVNHEVFKNQLSSVTKSCPTLWSPMNCSILGFPVLLYLPEFARTHVHWADDAIQPSHPLLSPSPLVLKLYQHQGLFQWVGSSHQVAKVLEFQLHHQIFEWIVRVDFL